MIQEFHSWIYTKGDEIFIQKRYSNPIFIKVLFKIAKILELTQMPFSR
jgi:hypothetical protein